MTNPVTTSIDFIEQPQSPPWAETKIEDPQSISTNFYWLCKVEGVESPFNLQTTLRGVLTPVQIAAHLDAVKHSILLITTQGGIPKQVGYKDGGAKSDASISIAITPEQIVTEALGTDEEKKAQTAPPVPQAPEFPDLAVERGATHSFHAKNLVVSVVGDKLKYKLREEHGPFSKYGVTIYEERLEEAGLPLDRLVFNKDHIDPTTKGTSYLCAGQAYYITNAEGKPEKVVLFVLDKKDS